MFEANAHLGEEAELYALGQLDARERDRVERHVRVCGACARRVGEAESTVLRLIEAGTPDAGAGALRPFILRRVQTWRWGAAIAAAFLVGLLPWLVSLRSTPAPPVQQVATTAMLHGHFQHAQFVADAPGAPAAKVIYGRSGEWIYVLAAPGDGELSVVTVAGDKKSTVATLAPSKETRAAFVPLSGHVDEVLLLQGTRRVAHANVVLTKVERR